MRELLQEKTPRRKVKNKKLAGICFLMAAGLLAGSSVQEAKAESVSQEPSWFTAGTIRSLALTRDGEEIFRISNEPADYKLDFDYWEILNPYDENATVDTQVMYELFEAVAAFDFSEAAETEPGTDTGIEDTETWLTVDFINTSDVAETATNTEASEDTAEAEAEESEDTADTEAEEAEDTNDSEASDPGAGTEGDESSVTLLIGSEDGEGKVYAAVQGCEEQVYKLPAETVAAVFDLNPFDYILKIPVLFNIETLDSVEIVIDEKNYTMKKDGGSYLFGKKKVEKETFTTLYQALMNVYLDSDAEEGKEDEQTEILRMNFYRNTEDAPDVELVYRAFDDTYNSLSINGKERFLVKAEDVEALVKQIKDAF
ncbi:MAG: hypothetical protein Q4C91_14500 [Eubacteriales bacterium]|nr:hypothetical protein [Eubacteriales bacterium]